MSPIQVKPRKPKMINSQKLCCRDWSLQGLIPSGIDLWALKDQSPNAEDRSLNTKFDFWIVYVNDRSLKDTDRTLHFHNDFLRFLGSRNLDFYAKNRSLAYKDWSFRHRLHLISQQRNFFKNERAKNISFGPKHIFLSKIKSGDRSLVQINLNHWSLL